MDDQHDYLVEVIGFNETERLMLSSIFGLAARRDPSFVQRPADAQRPPDLYLVDADSEAVMAEYLALRSRRPTPAVLIGASDHRTGLPLLARPMQWARVLQSLESAIQDFDGEPTAGTTTLDHEKAMLLLRTTSEFGTKTSGLGGANRTPAPVTAKPAQARRAWPARAPADSVLVVDDNATVRHFMQARLAPYGFNVDFAESGEQAVGLTGTTEYTCVFLDVILPGIDGYQVCKLIKGNKQAVKRTAVVMLTSRTSPFDRLRGSLSGCDAYLTKPVDENLLLEVIAKFLPSARAGA